MHRRPARDSNHSIAPLTGSRLAESEFKAELLREVDLFSGLNEQEIRKISDELSVELRPPGTLITSPGEEAERVYIIKRGRVRLYRLTSEGKQLTLDILGAGRIVGSMSWLRQQPSDVYAMAVDETLVCHFGAEELEALVSRHPVIGLNMIRHLLERVDACEEQREMAAFRSVEQRLAGRLLEFASRFPGEGTDGMSIDMRLTQQELADMVGTTRETMTAVIGRLRRRGVLEMQNHRVTLRDVAQLQRLAGRADQGVLTEPNATTPSGAG